MSILRQSESGADGLHGGVGGPLLNQPAKLGSLSPNSRTGGGSAESTGASTELIQRGLLTKGRIGPEKRPCSLEEFTQNRRSTHAEP